MYASMICDLHEDLLYSVNLIGDVYNIIIVVCHYS